MIKTILAFLGILLLVNIGYNQQRSVTQVQIEEDLLNSINSGNINYDDYNVIINQEGNKNNIVVEQKNIDALQNQVIINQSGDLNNSDIDIGGSNNRTVVNQQGAENQISTNTIGANNQFVLDQNGNHNTIVQRVESNNQNIELYQNGNFLELIQLENGDNASSLKVEQYGEGMKIVIENGIYK